MKRKMIGAAVTLFALIPICAHSAPILYAIDPCEIIKISPTDGSTISETAMSLSGRTIISGNGLATNPLTGELFAIVTVQGQSGGELVTINPATGVATSIGNTGDSFAGITFDSSGILYGVTGDGASTPETLFTLSLADASSTLVQTLGNGSDGEGIAFNSMDGLIYHVSGRDTNPAYETINPSTHAITNIGYSAFTPDEILGIVYDPLQNIFLATDLDGEFLSISTGGLATVLGSSGTPTDSSGYLRGLAFYDPNFGAPVPEPGTLALFGLGLAGLGFARRRKARAA